MSKPLDSVANLRFGGVICSDENYFGRQEVEKWPWDEDGFCSSMLSLN
jgi:hypothetical protein